MGLIEPTHVPHQAASRDKMRMRWIVNNWLNRQTARAFRKWQVRPEVDFITTTLDGVRMAPEKLISRMSSRLSNSGFTAAEGKSYPLHPSTTAYHHAMKYPGKTLCMEIRRDLLVEEFLPFQQMRIDSQKTQRICRPISESLVEYLSD